jgi:hypothetical protein
LLPLLVAMAGMVAAGDAAPPESAEGFVVIAVAATGVAAGGGAGVAVAAWPGRCATPVPGAADEVDAATGDGAAFADGAATDGAGGAAAAPEPCRVAAHPV